MTYKNKNTYKNVTITSIITAILITSGIGVAYANVGDVIQITSLEGIFPANNVFCSIGIAVDNQDTPRGYVDACGTGIIHQIDLINGTSLDSRDFTAEISERPNAMAFDSSRGGLWVCTQSSDNGVMPIYFIDFEMTFNDLSDDIVTKAFSVISPPADLSFNFCDGLAINLNDPGAADDIIFFSDDVNDRTDVFNVTGSHIGQIDNTLIDPSLSAGSGLAVGGDFLYMANNGGGDVFRANITSNFLAPVLVDQFISGDNRQEDLECDPISFAPIEVMWVRTTPQGNPANNVLTAYEIETNSCGVGGQSSDVFEKTLVEDLAKSDIECTTGMPIGALTTTMCTFSIEYIGDPLLIVDTVPAEWEFVSQTGSCTIGTAGNGNPAKSATIIDCGVTDNLSEEFKFETRQSPGNNNVKFAPTSCDKDLKLNEGALALDPTTLEVILTSNMIGTPTVDDPNDIDCDQIENDKDNCPAVANRDQSDIDNDGLGDACDSDIDGDGFPNTQETTLGSNPNDPADFPACGGSNTVDFCIDGDGFATPQRGAFTALWGDVLSTWPAQGNPPEGIDAMKTGAGWVIGISDLHSEDPTSCPGALRNAVHDLGLDCIILDVNGDLVNFELVTCDFEFTIPFGGCPAFTGLNSVTWIESINIDGGWNNGEDIILDVNGNGIFD